VTGGWISGRHLSWRARRHGRPARACRWPRRRGSIPTEWHEVGCGPGVRRTGGRGDRAAAVRAGPPNDYPITRRRRRLIGFIAIDQTRRPTTSSTGRKWLVEAGADERQSSWAIRRSTTRRLKTSR
jgi:hypothetical protein